MSTTTLLVILAIIEGIILTSMVVMLVLKGTNKLFLVSQLFIVCCIIGIFAFAMTKSEVVGYKGGVIIPLDEINDITKLEDGTYAVSFRNSKRECARDVIYGDETQFVMDCKLIKKTIFNIKLYDKSNILVIDDKEETDSDALTVNKENNIPKSEQIHNEKNKEK
mgnify:CR=1 FL=1